IFVRSGLAAMPRGPLCRPVRLLIVQQIDGPPSAVWHEPQSDSIVQFIPGWPLNAEQTCWPPSPYGPVVDVGMASVGVPGGTGSSHRLRPAARPPWHAGGGE